jgi:hypothetical protein
MKEDGIPDLVIPTLRQLYGFNSRLDKETTSNSCKFNFGTLIEWCKSNCLVKDGEDEPFLVSS